MKTNELSLQEMQDTNGGLSIRQIPETGGGSDMPVMDTPVFTPAEQMLGDGMWDQPQNSGNGVSPA